MIYIKQPEDKMEMEMEIELYLTADKDFKECSVCRNLLPITEFGRAGRSRKLHARCRTCNGIVERSSGLLTDVNNPWKAIIRTGTHSRWEKIIGCGADYFDQWIESQFSGGMCWDNKSEWQYDHIWSLHSYNFPSVFKSGGDIEAAVAHAGHFTNIAPMWKEDNIAKSLRCGDREYEPFRYTPERSNLIAPESEIKLWK